MICSDCPRRCAAPRTETAGSGLCGMGTNPVLARAGVHRWEEPCISGTRGSGAVFFSGCSLRCVFCQNEKISAGGFGRAVSVERLREIYRELIGQGVHNINLVTPTHFARAVADSLSDPLPVPVVYNCGGYENVETLRLLEGKVQIYLPDLKYLSQDLAERCSGAPDYPEAAKAAIQEMVRQTGPYVLDGGGILRSGVLIRHLMLPGQLENTFDVIDWVMQEFPPHTVLLSLMGQYIPCGRASLLPGLDRALTPEEYACAQDYLFCLGFEDGFVQELSAASEDYIPDFNLQGVFSSPGAARPDGLDCRLTYGTENIRDALRVRIEVFTDEQGFTDGEDETDAVSWHAVLYDGARPVAVGRAFPYADGVYKIGRVAVLSGWRGGGAGRRIMEELEAHLRRMGVRRVQLSAQDRAEGFYEKLGFRPVGESYLDENYPHRDMIKDLE